MARDSCRHKPVTSPLHNFVDYGRHKVRRGVTEITRRCTGCHMKVTRNA